MLQRVLMAIALAGEPDLLIADEATTALDVTIQAEVLDVLAELRGETGLTLLVVSHDLAVVAQVCDQSSSCGTARVVEHGHAADVLADPQHDRTPAASSRAPRVRRRAGSAPRRWRDG